MCVQVRVQKKYFFEFKFEFGKMIEFFRVQVRVRSPACDHGRRKNDALNHSASLPTNVV